MRYSKVMHLPNEPVVVYVEHCESSYLKRNDWPKRIACPKEQREQIWKWRWESYRYSDTILLSNTYNFCFYIFHVPIFLFFFKGFLRDFSSRKFLKIIFMDLSPAHLFFLWSRLTFLCCKNNEVKYKNITFESNQLLCIVFRIGKHIVFFIKIFSFILYVARKQVTKITIYKNYGA